MKKSTGNKLQIVVEESLMQAGVQPADALVVAVSGGVDSLSLLDIMWQTKHHFIAAHINHELRKNADADERLVKKYCEQHGIALATERVNLGKGKSGIEERARELRYAALRKIRQQRKARWILTAHTADDQVETVAVNWLRGSAVRGLGGMRLVSDDVVRPLLGVWKKELLAYAKQNKLKFATDESNRDTRFTRNRVRRELLPELRKFNSQLDQQILFNSRIWQQVEQALRALAQQYLQKLAVRTGSGVSLQVSKLKELTPLMQIEVVKAALGTVMPNIERTHFAEVMKILTSPKPQVAKRRLGGGLFVMKSRDKITVSRD